MLNSYHCSINLKSEYSALRLPVHKKPQQHRCIKYQDNDGRSAVAEPAVASDVGGLHEIVKDYGLLFPQGDAKALAAQIIKLYEDKGFYRQTAEQCYNRAKDFDINTMVEQYISLYQQSIG